MIRLGPINTNGVHRLNGGKPTMHTSGSVQIVNEDGGHTYTLGTIAEDNETFTPYNNGVITKDAHIRHGVGVVLALQVTGVSDGDDLLVLYSG